jgi:hypothetical protein
LVSINKLLNRNVAERSDRFSSTNLRNIRASRKLQTRSQLIQLKKVDSLEAEEAAKFMGCLNDANAG